MKKPWFLMRCMALLQPLNNKNGGINAETIAVKNKSGNIRHVIHHRRQIGRFSFPNREND